MTLAADFTDKLACPHCGMPLRKLGQWYVFQGEWRWKARPVRIQGPRKHRPEFDGERWVNLSRQETYEDKRSGLPMSRQIDEWWQVAEYECMGAVMGGDRCEAIVQAQDAVPYHGEVYADFMLLPDPPHKTPDAGKRIVAALSRKDMAAGERE